VAGSGTAKERPEQKSDEIYLEKMGLASFDILRRHLIETKAALAATSFIDTYVFEIEDGSNPKGLLRSRLLRDWLWS
jgi:hypothetical protein